MTITFFLPWPDRRLSGNGKAIKHARTKLAKAARKTGWACALHAKASRLGVDRLKVGFTFLPPDRRTRDDDNWQFALKHYRDGIADAVGVDDGKWTVSYQWGDVVPGGAVKVELAPA